MFRYIMGSFYHSYIILKICLNAECYTSEIEIPTVGTSVFK